MGIVKARYDLVPGDLAIVASNGSDTTHALADMDTRTRCGRDAADWMDLGTQNIAKFMDSAYSCRKCLRALADD